MDVQISQLSDVPELVRLVNSVYRGDPNNLGWTNEAGILDGQRVDTQMMSEMITTPDSVVLKAVQNQQLVACVHLQKKTNQVLLSMLSVSLQVQQGGLGKKMMEQCEHFVQKHWGLRQIYLKVINTRQELIAYYERRNYRLTGKVEDFPYNNEKFGLPKVTGLKLLEMMKEF